jgi:stringent starvation protein B
MMSSGFCFPSAPIPAIPAIYAGENGEGIFFDPEEEMSTEESGYIKPLSQILTSSEDISIVKSKPILKLVE